MRVYLAGPDVFHPEAVALGRRKKQICAAHGLEGLYPLDNEVTIDPAALKQAAMTIYAGNLALMRRADAGIFNMTPFRGASMDVGTAFELGFMRALGKPCFAYSNAPGLFAERVKASLDPEEIGRDAFGERDGEGWLIEDFGLVDNLMLDGAVEDTGVQIIRPGDGRTLSADDLSLFEACVRQAATALGMAGTATA